MTENLERLIDEIMSRTPCSSCGETVGQESAHCMACGQGNEAFSEDRFQERYNRSLEEVRREVCERGEHAAIMAEGVESPRLLRQDPFCQYCGKRVELAH